MLSLLISALGPLAIKGVVLGVEKIFGPKTGSVKLEAATQAIAGIANQLIAQGKLPNDIKKEDLQQLIQLFVQQMNDSGELPKAGVAQGFSGTLVFQNGILVKAV